MVWDVEGHRPNPVMPGKKFSAPIVWNFAPEQIQNPAEVGKYLKENCNDSSKEIKLIAVCWALGNAYCTL